jgi:hypothetical protein
MIGHEGLVKAGAVRPADRHHVPRGLALCFWQRAARRGGEGEESTRLIGPAELTA